MGCVVEKCYKTRVAHEIMFQFQGMQFLHSTMRYIHICYTCFHCIPALLHIITHCVVGVYFHALGRSAATVCTSYHTKLCTLSPNLALFPLPQFVAIHLHAKLIFDQDDGFKSCFAITPGSSTSYAEMRKI